MSEAVIAVLALLQQLIPILGTSAANEALIDGVITALIKLEPYIVDELSTLYTATKNVIDLLQSSGAVTPAQLARLQQIDARVDAAWAAILPQIDPDNPANAGTPAGN